MFVKTKHTSRTLLYQDLTRNSERRMKDERNRRLLRFNGRNDILPKASKAAVFEAEQREKKSE